MVVSEFYPLKGQLLAGDLRAAQDSGVRYPLNGWFWFGDRRKKEPGAGGVALIFGFGRYGFTSF